MDVVLDGERHAIKATKCLGPPPALFAQLRGRPRTRAIEGHDGVDDRVYPLGTIEDRVQGIDG